MVDEINEELENEEIETGDKFEYSEDFDVFNHDHGTEEPTQDNDQDHENEEGQEKKSEEDPEKEEDDSPDYESMYNDLIEKNNDLSKKVDGLLQTVTEERQRKRTAQIELDKLRGGKKEDETTFNWEDPNKTISELDLRLDQKVQTVKLDLSEAQCKRMHDDYGEKYKVFTEMAQANPAYISEMLKQPDPAEWAYQEASRKMSMSEIGDDPAAYKESLKEQIRAELLAEMKAEKIDKKIDEISKTKIPPSGAKMTGKTTGTDDIQISDDPLGDMWGPDR